MLKVELAYFNYLHQVEGYIRSTDTGDKCDLWGRVIRL
jgi:hypothetical protein